MVWAFISFGVGSLVNLMLKGSELRTCGQGFGLHAW